jgi:hypothetical protein
MPHHRREHCCERAPHIRDKRFGDALSGCFAVELRPNTLSITITTLPSVL